MAADGRVKTADVGVVTHQRTVLGPERVHGADTSRDRAAAPAERGKRFLVRNGDVARCQCVAQQARDLFERRGSDVHRLVSERDPRAPQRGVLHGWRERVRDGVA
jgi:hypothetical protein